VCCSVKLFLQSELDFHYIVYLQGAPVCCSVPLVYHSVLQSVAECCSVLQCVAVCCRVPTFARVSSIFMMYYI